MPFQERGLAADGRQPEQKLLPVPLPELGSRRFSGPCKMRQRIWEVVFRVAREPNHERALELKQEGLGLR